MVTQELLQYIQNELQNGKNANDVMQTVIASGWLSEDVQQVFAQLGYQTQQSTTPPPPPNISASTNPNFGVYPLITIQHITNPNRLYAIPVLGILIKVIITLPQSVVIYLLFLITPLILVLNSLLVLFTGKYWGLANTLVRGQMILFTKTLFFTYGLTNKYPGFAFFSIQDNYQVIIDHPVQPNRLFAFPVFGGIIRLLFLIPFNIWLAIVTMAAQLGIVISTIPVLFVGKYPESTFELAVDSVRLYDSTTMYYSGLSDKYPSFHISMNHKIPKILLLIIPTIIFVGSLLLQPLLLFVNPNALHTLSHLSFQTSKQRSSIPTGWKIALCSHKQISLYYPPTWQATIVDNPTSCFMNIVQVSPPSLFTLSLLNNTTWDDTLKKYPNAKMLTVAGSPAIQPTAIGIPTQSLVGYYINRGTDVVGLSYVVNPKDATSATTYNQIVASLNLHDTSTSVRQASSFSQLHSLTDKIRGSDVYKIQEAIFSKTVNKPPFPSSLDSLKSTSYGFFPLQDPTGVPFTYTVLDNGNDYSISSKLDDGSIYTVYGSSFVPQTSNDTFRMSDVTQIMANLQEYFYTNHAYPTTLNALITNNGTTLPADPVTHIPYTYSPTQSNQSYTLETHLDNGLDYIATPEISGTPATIIITPTIIPTANISTIAYLDVSGIGNQTTQEFTTTGAWTTKYSYDCTASPNNTSFSIDEMRTDGFKINLTQSSGQTTFSDSVDEASPGTYWETITTTCSWHITTLPK